MEYKVSEKIQKKFDTLTKDAKVQKALQFMEDDQNEIIDRKGPRRVRNLADRRRMRRFYRCLTVWMICFGITKS